MKRANPLKRIVTALVCGAICFSLSVFSSSAAGEKPVFSYGINVLAAETDMAVNAPVGNDVVFSADDFERNLNLSRVEYITVRSLPEDTQGELLLGSTRVAAGETVSRENISHLTFVAADEDITQASFTFSSNGSATALTCNVYLMRENNYTPTVSMASGLSLNVSTYRDLCAHGKLSAYDPDGDEMVFEIVTYPQNGTVCLDDKNEGSYVYTPTAGYVGSDSFRYVARDRYGNYSAGATVNLTVSTLGISVTYADMLDSPAYTSALKLAEAGIMSGTQVGNQQYFYPSKSVSRAEFLLMAMNAAGIKEVPRVLKTVFYEDEKIEPSMK
ncbi:MAG: cadherin-like domain-containing protein [Clostridia bacterium]|nr:cadherin-like domain-containing protein [Clostridia bacterium]